MNGPRVRTDVIDVYVVRRRPDVAVLQLRRSRAPFVGDWHPIMGHIEPGETAIETAVREMSEEIGLLPAHPEFVALFQLEQTFPFFLADRNEVMLSPRFAVEVGGGFTPVLNDEHDDHRWVPIDEPHRFIWPGQRHAIEEIRTAILPDADTARALRLRPAAPGRVRFARPRSMLRRRVDPSRAAATRRSWGPERACR